MDKPKIIFVLNPVAGTRKTIDKNVILEKFEHREVHFVETLAGREKIINDFLKTGVEDFVVIGGDGTVNGVASLLMNTNARLGIVASGSGNGLARDLGLPMNFEIALERIKNGTVRTIDAGLLNNLPFFCTAGVGFDAICAYDFAHKKHRRGLWNYVKIILANYFSFKSICVTLSNEKQFLFSLTFANASQFGNNAFIAPNARLNDGLLDYSVILPHSKMSAFTVAFRLMKGTLGSSRYFKTKQFKEIKVTKISDRRIHIDGESRLLEEDSIEVKVIEKALNVIV